MYKTNWISQQVKIVGEVLSRPHNSVTSKEIRIKIRFINSFTIFLTVIAFFYFFLSLLVSFEESRSNIQLYVPLFTSICAFFVYLGGRSQYYQISFIITTAYPIISPWFNLSTYLNNSYLVADQILLNMTLTMGLGIVFCGLLYSGGGVIVYSLLSSFNLFIFYKIVLGVPESWLIPKIAFLSLIAFISLLSLRARELSYNLLAKQTKEFRTVYDSARVALVTLNREGIILSTNPATVDILGYDSLDSLIGIDISKFGINQDYQENLRKELQKKEFVDNIELTITKKDGTPVFVLMSASIVRNEQGKTQKIETVIRDITERKKAEQARKDLEKRREDFIAMTNHQLRTPLHISKGYSELLINQFDALSPEEVTQYLHSLERNLTRLERLFSDFGRVQTLEKGELELDFRPINLDTFIPDFLAPYQELEQYCSLSVEFQEDNPIIVQMDKESFHQALDNLIENSLKQTDKNTREIKLFVQHDQENVRISVQDNGAGIEKNQLTSIFEKYTSIETELSAKGTGIGLYIAQRIIEAHGGKLTAESGGKGHGATFHIELPISTKLSNG